MLRKFKSLKTVFSIVFVVEMGLNIAIYTFLYIFLSKTFFSQLYFFHKGIAFLTIKNIPL